MAVTRRNLLSLTVAGSLAVIVPFSVRAQDKITVAIGQKGLWDTMVTVHGVDQGFFKEEGLEVEIIYTRGGSETLQAVITGSAQFAMVNGVLGVLGAFAKGAPLRIVSAQMTGSPDLFWYAKADSPINSLKDADGKTMGFSRPGSSTHLVSLELANAAGVKPELTPTGGISDTKTQVLSGQIDIGWSVPPFNLALVRKGEIKIVARGGDVPSLAEQTIRVNVVNADFLASNRETVEKFMRGYAKALDWMYSMQDDAVKAFAAFNNVDLDVAKDSVAFYPKESMAMAPIAGLEASMKQAVEYKQLDAPLSDDQVKELLQLLP
ncbi:MAG: ABC transporter substrate-binding protein [Hyphomicrobiales bacterium]|nr:ABC transporter substrate-binding protein [Hyphomicrobiales bacterium]